MYPLQSSVCDSQFVRMRCTLKLSELSWATQLSFSLKLDVALGKNVLMITSQNVFFFYYRKTWLSDAFCKVLSVLRPFSDLCSIPSQ